MIFFELLTLLQTLSLVRPVHRWAFVVTCSACPEPLGPAEMHKKQAECDMWNAQCAGWKAGKTREKLSVKDEINWVEIIEQNGEKGRKPI